MKHRNGRKLDRQPFKGSMTFRNLDFDTNKAAQYSAYVRDGLLFIVMMKLYLAQLKLQVGRRLLPTVTGRSGYSVKRD